MSNEKITYTMVIHQLAPEFNLSALENIFMCTVMSIANKNPAHIYEMKRGQLINATGLTVDGLRKMRRRLQEGGVLIQVCNGVYKANAHYRRRYNQLRFELQEENGYKTNLKVLANAV